MKKSQIFSQVPGPRVSRNLFDLSHEVKMSGKFALLMPVLLMDTLPGDVVRDQMTAMVRFAPLLAPVMHRVDVTTHFFFVPNRLVTNLWESFITGGQDGTEAPVLPYMTPFSYDFEDPSLELLLKGTLWDYMGLPPWDEVAPGAFSTQAFSLLPFRAYQKIWNDYYRDPNFDDEIELSLDAQGGQTLDAITNGILNLHSRAWEKDYFTSALPWAQRGAQVLMPLSGTGSVTYLANSNLYEGDGDKAAPGALSAFDVGLESRIQSAGAAGTALRVENIDDVLIENSNVSINDFRRAIAIQSWLENNARGGGRYIEQIQSHFNQRVPDFRLQRAEYLGGGKQPVVISEVLSTADTAEVPVGDMAGHGLSVGKSNRFSYRCQEHGFVLGIMSVVPRTAYQQGVERLWTRTTKYDYAWPELAHLGEQEILSKEVYYSYDGADDDGNNEVFGYTPRYAEYKFKQDRIAGDFRTNLAFWHLGRIFDARPVLDEVFTTMSENGTDDEQTYRRIFAVQDGTDYLWIQLFHRLTAKRPLPYFGVPANL